MAKLRRLPKKIKIPGRYKVWEIDVKLAPGSVVDELNESHGCTGYWDDEGCKIVLSQDVELADQWRFLLHELQHALLDIEHYMDVDSEDEIDTK